MLVTITSVLFAFINLKMNPILTYRLFGDESEVHFWTVALFYLRYFRAHGPLKVSINNNFFSLF